MSSTPPAAASEPHGPPAPPSSQEPGVPTAAEAERAREALERVRAEIGTVIVGQDGVISGLVTALLVRGHVLLEGVPGVAKTLLVTTLARSLDLDAARVQFTPDLMPADVTGQTIHDRGGEGFRFREGPVFTNLLLADEINRTPPRTQAALLEAMQERQVSVDGQSRPLPEPFLVVATQNPVEHEGTYPLPEAQLDRFLFKLQVPYPSRDQELEIVARHATGTDAGDPHTAAIRAVAGARFGWSPSARRCAATSSTWCGPPARPRRWSSVCRPGGPRCCCTPPRPGHGSPGAATSPPTR